MKKYIFLSIFLILDPIKGMNPEEKLTFKFGPEHNMDHTESLIFNEDFMRELYNKDNATLILNSIFIKEDDVLKTERNKSLILECILFYFSESEKDLNNLQKDLKENLTEIMVVNQLYGTALKTFNLFLERTNDWNPEENLVIKKMYDGLLVALPFM